MFTTLQETESNMNRSKYLSVRLRQSASLSDAQRVAIRQELAHCQARDTMNVRAISRRLNGKGIKSIVIKGVVDFNYFDNFETSKCVWSVWECHAFQTYTILCIVSNQKTSNLKQEVKKLKEQNKLLQNRNKALIKKLEDGSKYMDELKKNIKEYESKEGRTYLRHQIFSYKLKPKPSKLRNNIISMHNQNMKEWMVFTKNMNHQYKECKQNVDNNNNKENDGNTSILLSSYIECKKLWQQQQNQMESITECLSELTQKKIHLKTLITNHSESGMKTHNQYKEELFGYNQIKQRRVNLENELRTKMIELNDCCDEENKLNEKQCKLLNAYNTIDIELKEIKSMLEKCNILIKKYTEFDLVNEDTINEMEKYFDHKWIECMKKWYEWNSESIICWIKYLREKKKLVLSNNIDLNKILQQMKNDKVNGHSLVNIDKDDLKSIGFEILSDRKEVFDKIRKLISKYPDPSIYNDEGNNNNNDNTVEHEIKIPTEFLCPLSNKIMKNPVQIFDGNTYEKSEIETYLNKYNKSPTTNTECDENDIWFTRNRKLQQKIWAFLCVNPQFDDITVDID